jgi:hypothetical protein
LPHPTGAVQEGQERIMDIIQIFILVCQISGHAPNGTLNKPKINIETLPVPMHIGTRFV